MKPVYLKDTNTIKLIKETILGQIQEGTDYPYLYSVITFGFYDNYGIKLPISETSKYWDKTEVDKTCKLIYNMLKEHFGMDGLWFFIERHSPLLYKDGNIEKEGRFHINIISSSIKDYVIEEPNRKVRRLMLENGRSNVPIENNVYKNIDDLKIELFNACCKRANWVNRYKYSVKTEMLYEPTDLENVVYYCLGDYTGKYRDKKKNPVKNKVDFTDIIVWKASDFYKP
jgi:hypothetical protein